MNTQEIIEQHPDLYSWFTRSKNSWANKMSYSLNKKGYLSVDQVSASVRIMHKDSLPKAPVMRVAVDIQAIEVAFDIARSKGVARPKLRLGNYKLSAAPLTGRNPGAIYVTHTESDTYLGKVFKGALTTVPQCTNEQLKEIQEVCAEPDKAAKAYGMRTGVCCICGRELTNHASIDLGIGPICADNFGWS